MLTSARRHGIHPRAAPRRRHLHPRRRTTSCHVCRLPPRQLEPAPRCGAAPPRSRQHLPDHRRQLHPIRAAPAPGAGHNPADHRLGGSARGRALPHPVDGRTPLALCALVCRPRPGGGLLRPAHARPPRGTHAHPRGRRRRALHPGRGGLRPAPARPLTALVRIPRDLPHVDDPGVPDPLRGRLARPLLARRAQLRTHARHRPRPCPVAARARQGGAAVHRGSTPRTGPHRPPRA